MPPTSDDAVGANPPAHGGALGNEAKGEISSVGTPSSAGGLLSEFKQYYNHLFPVGLFTGWLRYGRNETFSNREISFTLPGDIYIRGKAFDSEEEFKADLVKSTPLKIDIGAVYNQSPKQKSLGTITNLIPMSKELVFDIDMTDYADVLGTIGGGDAMEECDRCWKVMATAVTILDAALREDFGFQHLLWVYSGRRGVHCWVADERARKMNNEQRSAVAEFLYVRFEDRENVGRKQSAITVPMHPSLMRAREKCTKSFREFCLEEAGILSTDQAIEHTLGYLPTPAARVGLKEKLRSMSTAGGVAKWERMEKELKKETSVLDHLVLRHLYPRLDVNVSKQINHLLKAPFSVHPKTGRVCVPFLASEAYSFQPQVHSPVLSALLSELNEKGSSKRRSGGALEQFRKAEKIFEKFVDSTNASMVVSNRAVKLDCIDKKAAAELMTH